MIIPPFLNYTGFRYAPEGFSEKEIDEFNQVLLGNINNEGKLFISHTKVFDKYVIRMVIGQTYVEKRHVILAVDTLKKHAVYLLKEHYQRF